MNKKGAGASAIPDTLDAAQCKEFVGEAKFDQATFDKFKSEEGTITGAQLTDVIIESLFTFKPAGARREDVQPVWTQISAGWAAIPGLLPPVIEQFRGMVGFMDQAPEEDLAL